MEKLIRLLRRSREPHGGDQLEASKSYTDEVQAFFIAAYHVKDYVRREDPVWLTYPIGRVKGESEALFHGKKQTWATAFTHDLCNGIKHAELEQSKYTDVTRIRGIRAISGKRSDGLFDVATAYVTEDGIRFADDVMVEILSMWLDFIETSYVDNAANPLRSMLENIGPKPEGIVELEQQILKSVESGQAPDPMPLSEELPADEADLAAYWASLPEIPIPTISDPQEERGQKVMIEEIQLIPVSSAAAKAVGISTNGQTCFLPAAHLSTKGGLARIRFPYEYGEIFGGMIGFLDADSSLVFPSLVEIGRIEGGPMFGGYYVELLDDEGNRLPNLADVLGLT